MDMEKENKIWDVVVVGGGPAGMMTAGRAGERGLNVLLIEKNESLGKKLLITGGGRCNVTNSQFDTRKLLDKYKDGGKFLFSAFSQYDVSKSLDFFHSRGMDTKVENELRTFPTSNSAQSVWDVQVNYLKQGNVTVLSNTTVKDFLIEDNKITGVVLTNPSKFSKEKFERARNIVIATGGTSRPETGSTGDAYKWLRTVGHTVTEPEPSLVPVTLTDTWVKRLAGVSLTDIKLTSHQNNVKQEVARGKILFTHVGVSGPTVLNMSKDIGELLKYGEVELALDLLPHEDYSTLNSKLQELFKEHDKKKFRNALSNLVPSAIAPIVTELSLIDPEKQCNAISREERLKLVNLLKHIPMHVDKLLGIDKAIITSGGVELEEIDFKTMQSRIHPNLYLVGDILNIDRPSGGYSLQLCWTTGYVAGNSIK